MEKKHSLVLVDSNEKQMKELEEAVIRKYADDIDVQIITDRAYLQKYFESRREIDLLIISEEDFREEILEKNHIRRTFLMRGEVGEDENRNGSVRVMLKHLPVHEIFEAVDGFFAEFAEEEEPEQKTPRDTRVIAVFSPIGGCGKSLISIALARKLKKLDQKVLLTGCDDLQSFSVFFSHIEYADDRLAQELREPGDDTYWTILQNIKSDGFSYLKPFERVPHAVGVGRTQFSAYVTLMKEKQDFDFLILDIGSRVDEASVALMDKADEIVLVTEPTLIAMRKMARIAGDEDMLPQKKCVLISDQFHSDGLRYGEDAIFDSLPAYIRWQDAMEDPIFYRLALSMIRK